MRRGIVTLLALVTALSFSALPAGASPNSDAAGAGYVFAGGGTLLSNGVFFPGTAICDEAGCTVVGPPNEIQKGTDFTFAMVDAEAVANSHQIVSVKVNKKTRKPLFYSDVLTTPGERDLVLTSKLKPGTYFYRCTVHFGMYGAIDIVR
jgi:hypothetical protein